MPRPPNGLELSRLASPRLVSHRNQTLGWPGRLHRVVRRPERSQSRVPVSSLKSRRRTEKPSRLPQIGNMRLANHLGRKMSVTWPLTAPMSSAYVRRGQRQPLATKTIPSIKSATKASQVRMEVWPERAENRTMRLAAEKNQNAREWITLMNVSDLSTEDQPLCGRGRQAWAGRRTGRVM